MGIIRRLYEAFIRTGVRDAKVQCSVCGHYCDIHRIRTGPPPKGMDMGDAFICLKCKRLYCFACSTQWVLASLNQACPECGGSVKSVPIWRKRAHSD